MELSCRSLFLFSHERECLEACSTRTFLSDKWARLKTVQRLSGGCGESQEIGTETAAIVAYADDTKQPKFFGGSFVGFPSRFYWFRITWRVNLAMLDTLVDIGSDFYF